ncbi:MAG: TetR/AcrR family transcriptional regulator [Lactobacillus sp.]|nr:MAG: TetR/AcrR family transcriptional regulator [Lactobacillus sp.]
MPTHQERIAQTDAAILNALVTVGRTKSLNRITVSDLTRLSGISRGTFYLHYLDKDDLVTTVENSIFSSFQLMLDTGIDGTMNYQDLSVGQPYPVIEDIVAFAAENKAILSFLFGPNGDPAFAASITAMLQKSILSELKRVKGTAVFRNDLPQQYSLCLVTNAIMSVVLTWLSSDDLLSENELSKVIMRTLYLSPYDLLGITVR